jgi:hypothetical protein
VNDVPVSSVSAGSDASISILPADRVRVPLRAPRVSSVMHACAPALAERMRASSRAHECPVELEWLTVIVALVGRFSRDDLVTLDVSRALSAVALPTLAAPTRPEHTRVTVDVSGDPDLRMLTERVQNALLLSDQLLVEGDAPIVGVLCCLAGETTLPSAECVLSLGPTDAVPVFTAQYDSNIFDVETVKRLLDCAERFHAAALAEPRRMPNARSSSTPGTRRPRRELVRNCCIGCSKHRCSDRQTASQSSMNRSISPMQPSTALRMRSLQS